MMTDHIWPYEDSSLREDIPCSTCESRREVKTTQATLDETPEAIAVRLTVAKWPGHFNEEHYGPIRLKYLQESGPKNCTPMWMEEYYYGVIDAVKELRRG